MSTAENLSRAIASDYGVLNLGPMLVPAKKRKKPAPAKKAKAEKKDLKPKRRRRRTSATCHVFAVRQQVCHTKYGDYTYWCCRFMHEGKAYNRYHKDKSVVEEWLAEKRKELGI